MCLRQIVHHSLERTNRWITRFTTLFSVLIAVQQHSSFVCACMCWPDKELKLNEGKKKRLRQRVLEINFCFSSIFFTVKLMQQLNLWLFSRIWFASVNAIQFHILYDVTWWMHKSEPSTALTVSHQFTLSFHFCINIEKSWVLDGLKRFTWNENWWHSSIQ